MNPKKHILSDISEESKTAFCSLCGLVTICFIRDKKDSPRYWACRRKLNHDNRVKEHILSKICDNSKTAFCSTCGLVSVYPRKRNNKIYWACIKNSPGKADRKKKFHRSMKKDTCEICGFEAKSPRQLDIHHKDGNHYNDVVENLQTVCANCHRLIHDKTDEQVQLEYEAKLIQKRWTLLINDPQYHLAKQEVDEIVIEGITIQ